MSDNNDDKSSNPLRPLEEQFEPRTVENVRKLQGAIRSLPFYDGAGRVYGSELVYSLEAGLLLAGLHLATSLLELFIRDLLLYAIVSTQKKEESSSLLNSESMEKILEDSTRPLWSFSRMVDALEERNVITHSDAVEIKDYYSTVRIPIHNGLSRRFIRGQREVNMEPAPLDLLEFVFFGRPMRRHSLEDKLEDEAIELVQTAVDFMRKYTEREIEDL